jgi:hypothetical protein
VHRFLVLVLAAVCFGVGAATAFSAQPVHETLTASGTDSAPAGALCDFAYQLDFDVTIHQTRFFEESVARSCGGIASWRNGSFIATSTRAPS